MKERIKIIRIGNNIKIDKTLEMDGMIGTLEMVASSDWCAILPAVLCDLDILGNLRTLSPLTSPNLMTEYVLITSASKELSSAAKLFSKKMCDEIKSITGPLFHRKDIGKDDLIQKRIDHMRSLR